MTHAQFVGKQCVLLASSRANTSFMSKYFTCFVIYIECSNKTRFFRLCLRRWLEQDSSCAICRKTLSLNLNHVLREDGGNVDEVDPTFQYMMEALHPQNNGLFR